MIQLWEHDSGIDGWDATSRLAHVFTTRDKAIAWLTGYGFTHVENAGTAFERFAHQDVNKRHCMGQITYCLIEVKDNIDPAPPAKSSPRPPNALRLKAAIRSAFNREWNASNPPASKRKAESDAIDALLQHAFKEGFEYGNRGADDAWRSCYDAWLKSEAEDSGACCTNEMRGMDGGCVNCGDPCL